MDISNKLTSFLHQENVQAKRNALSHNDEQNLKSSLSVQGAINYLSNKDKVTIQGGMSKYKYDLLTPKIARKLDTKLNINGATEEFLKGAEHNVEDPTDGDGEPDYDSNFHKNTRISKQALDNGSFQKNVVKDLSNLANQSIVGNPDFDIRSYSASNISHILNKESAKGFSKNALDYLQAKRKSPETIISFSELSKHQPQLSHKNSFTSKTKSLQTDNHNVAKRSTQSRNKNRDRKLNMKRNQGMER